MKYCSYCGAEIADQAIICPKCGCAVGPVRFGVSEKSWVVTLLLCLFLGSFGIHRFYVGKIGTGVLMLLTIGCLGLWTLIDFIVILCKSFRDDAGLIVSD